MNSMETRDLILRYFNSWPQGDYDTMRACLAPHCTIEAGVFRFDSAEALYQAAKMGAPWRDVTLLDAIFEDNHGALIYTGVNTENDKTMRVAEFITVAEGRISKIQTVISQIN